jgi:hypothetical protein
MFTFAMFRRRDDRRAPAERRRQGRNRGLSVESLEGRKLLSTFVQGSHIGSNVAAIQGNHIGMSVAAIQGNHIGMSVAAIQGNHIGYSM